MGAVQDDAQLEGSGERVQGSTTKGEEETYRVGRGLRPAGR